MKITGLGLMLLFLFFQNNLSAQDKLNVKFGKVKPEDFDIKSALIDSGTNAVVVADVGNSEFSANSSQLTFSLIFKGKKRIKIINKNGFDAATITIPLYLSDNNNEEKLSGLEGYTYNLENNQVVETKVDKSSVFTERHSKNWIYKKFTFPALKEGSIIEYTYQIQSAFFFNLQPWYFQGKYPVLWSQYDVAIPDFFKYVVLAQGYQPFFINDVNKTQQSFSFTERTKDEKVSAFDAGSGSNLNTFKINGNIDNHRWVMKDVPGLKEEMFTTTLRNSIAKIEFQLNQVAYPNSLPTNYLDSWEKLSKDLYDDEKFGLPISRANNWLDDDENRIVNTVTSKKEKAKKIYEYIRDNFAANNNNDGIYITTGLKDVFKNKAGTVTDINMLLIAMLKNQHIDVNPVILSTRDNGFTHEFYPLIYRYNYVIAKAVIDNEVIYLDASIPHLAFNKLPAKVYNGQAREITKGLAIPLYFMPDSIKQSSTTAVFIFNGEKGGVEGSFNHEMGFYESLDFRSKMDKSSYEEYKKSLQQQYPEEISIDNLVLDSIKKPDMPVAVEYDMKLKAFDVEADIVYFNPMMGEYLKKNPFVAAERFYPVEMPYTTDDMYTFSMEIPKGYKVDELPKSVKFSLNENEGMFEYLITNNGTEIQMRCRLNLNKATYLNEDYKSIRDFYSFVVQKESEQIVFKKIK